jgi:hypothetical protein
MAIPSVIFGLINTLDSAPLFHCLLIFGLINTLDSA